MAITIAMRSLGLPRTGCLRRVVKRVWTIAEGNGCARRSGARALVLRVTKAIAPSASSGGAPPRPAPEERRQSPLEPRRRGPLVRPPQHHDEARQVEERHDELRVPAH